MITALLLAATLGMSDDNTKEYVINYVDRKGTVSCLTKDGAPLAGLTDLKRSAMKKMCTDTEDCPENAEKEAKPFFFEIEEFTGPKAALPKGLAKIKLKEKQVCWLDRSKIRTMKVTEGLEGRDIACAAGSTAASFGSHKCEG